MTASEGLHGRSNERTDVSAWGQMSPFETEACADNRYRACRPRWGCDLTRGICRSLLQHSRQHGRSPATRQMQRQANARRRAKRKSANLITRQCSALRVPQSDVTGDEQRRGRGDANIGVARRSSASHTPVPSTLRRRQQVRCPTGRDSS